MAYRRRLIIALSTTLAAVSIAAQTPSRAADAVLVAAAEKEGRVTWYTTQIVNQFVLPVARAFEQKYGIKIDYVRADTSEIALRVLNEARAGKVQADVVDGTLTPPTLKKQGLVLKWAPDGSSRMPKQYVDEDGFWVATNVNIITPGINTDLVPPGSAPKTYADLLDPKWKGKMAWSSNAGATAGAPGFVGAVLSEMGEDKGMAYLRALASQNIASLSVGARQVLDMIIAGEYPIALQIFNNHAVMSAVQGAPVAWIPMNPATGVAAPISVTAAAPHVNAAKLLVDFLVSPEGQALVRDGDMLPVDPAVPPRVLSLLPDGAVLRATFFTPETIEGSMPKWTKIFQELFR